MPLRIRSAAAIFCVLCATRALAQDSNYWSTAYGTRAQLLGGVVIGSPGDISSVYYNPGALALAPNTEFLLAGNAIQYMRVSVENGSGPKKDLISSTITTVPALLAGEIPVLKRDRPRVLVPHPPGRGPRHRAAPHHRRRPRVAHPQRHLSPRSTCSTTRA
jgi:hypothetical protein